jgi:hypothetical protein
VLQDLALALERELPRLQSDLQVTSTRPFGVRVFQDESAWFAEVQSYFGRRIDTSGYVTEPEEGIRGRVVRLRPTALSSVAARSVRAIASLGEE